MSFQSPNYTQVPNDLFDEIMSDMDGSELKVVLCIVRQTIGYHRDNAKFSISKLMKMSGLSRNSVKTGVEKAEKRGLIERLNPDSQGSAEWGLSVTPSTIDDTPSIVDPSPSIIEGQSRVKESIKETVKETDPILFSEEANQKIKETESMVFYVEEILNTSDIDLGGNGKWYKAIQYLIKVEKEKGWDIKTMWDYLNSEALQYKKDIPSIGTIMKNPDTVFKSWMPLAHQAKTESTQTEPDKGGGQYV